MQTNRLLSCAISVIAALHFVASAAGDEKLREWTDTTGSFQVDARFVRYRDGRVTLLRFDGKQIEVSLSRLSRSDRTYVRDTVKRLALATKRSGETAAEPRRSGPTSESYLARRAEDPLAKHGVPGCRVCREMRFLPRMDLRSFLHQGDSTSADASTSLSCRHCPECSAEKDYTALLRREEDRIEHSGSRHSEWESKLQLSLQRLETRQLVLRGFTTEAELLRVGQALEAMTLHLRQKTNSLLLTQRRPHSDEMFVFDEEPEYEHFLSVLEESGRYPHVDWKLMRRRIGSSCARLSFLHSPPGKAPAEHSAVHASAYCQLKLATADLASPWFLEGFAAYCEHAATGGNLIHGVVAQSGDVELTPHWAAQLRQLVRTEEPPKWSELLSTDLAVYRAIHYLEAKSIVTFLLREPPAFLDFVELKSVGMKDPEALKVAYGRSVDELDEEWRSWLGVR